MEQKNQEQKMEEQAWSPIIKFGMNYITKEEETIKLPKHVDIIKVDTVNGIPTIFWKASEHGITETADVTIKLVGPQDSYDCSKYEYLGMVKVITQARIQLQQGPNIQETPLHVLKKK